jgi:transglutaminase-like putative cysteine protease
MASNSSWRLLVVLASAIFALSFAPTATLAKDDIAPRTRKFAFNYGTTISGLKPGEEVSVWVPMPPIDADQRMDLASRTLPAGAKSSVAHERKYGNRIMFVKGPAGQDGHFQISLAYRIVRHELKSKLQRASNGEVPAEEFLSPDSLVPIDGKPLDLLKGKALPEDPIAKARSMYDIVNGHMRYSKEGSGWGRGDSVWACESGYGNCTDFHSLFISLMRSQKIAAKFEIGFLLPTKRGTGEIAGYHCWAKFRPPGCDWIPVDISEANKNPNLRDYYFGDLSEDRVTFSTGRDIVLVPKQSGKPLNFFVYPYVEVAGTIYPANRIESRYSFEDLPGTEAD